LSNTSPLPDVLTTTVESPDDPDAALAADETLDAFAAAVEPPGDDQDAALADDAEELPEANAGDGGKPTPQPRCDCEFALT